MKAAILQEPGKLEVTETKTPECLDGHVLVKIKACGICTADVKMLVKGHRAMVYPRIPGHEISGIVSESMTDQFRKGDRVQVGPGLRCGKCARCLDGDDNQCGQREILGFTRDGGFAEYISVPLEGDIVGALNPIPDNVGFEKATLAEPVACSINAQEKAGVDFGDTVLITGAGPLGMLNSFVARHNNAEMILISETNARRRKTVETYYADVVLNPMEDGFFSHVMDITGGNGVDVIIFACSQTGLNESYLKILKPGGKISLFSGTSLPVSSVQFDQNIVHYNEIKITGAYGCTVLQNRQALGMIADSIHPIEEIITNRVKLDRLIEGFDYTEAKNGLKTIVEV